jgi:putative heme-binding domain-containing protein
MKSSCTLAVLLVLGSIVWMGRDIADAQVPKGKGKGKRDAADPAWIWHGTPSSRSTVYFRKQFSAPGPVDKAILAGTCDNQMTVWLDGKEVLASDSWENPVSRDVTDFFKQGKEQHTLAVRGRNADGAAGLMLRLTLEGGKRPIVIGTDGSWRASDKAAEGWLDAGFNDAAWAQAAVVGKLGGAPWTQITQATLGGGKYRKATATPIELIKVKKDFKVELLYSVPRETQGSWVNLCVDPKGRLITSDQYGRLWRVTPPALDGKPEDTKVEMLPVDLGEAQGLCWAFDSLYVVVNRGKKYESGLYRVRASGDPDVLDTKEKLRGINGGGEHGPHAVMLTPDGKALAVLCGNHTRLTELAGSKVPQVWEEDFLIPRMWDASGHAVGIMAPGGHIYRVDPDGKNWVPISIGYRNQYDAAYNRDGELFTYDSDMEWFMNLPFYRPTRVMHAVDGSDFGWRSGTATKPVYYPDNLPAAVDIGPGSPCGVCFGYGAKFPRKYQDAFFICDWSYGKLYAVHLSPKGASYTGEAEEFLNGSPLPLTDIVVNPKDAAMYFTIGGRNTMSGLYRITYVGNESTAPAPAEAGRSAQREARHKLEAFYDKKDAAAIPAAWPHLDSDDRFMAWAARTALEFQDPATWQDKALAEKNPVALTHALVGLARVGDKALQPKLLEALERVDFHKLTTPQQLDYLRAYQLVFIRMGPPTETWKDRVAKRLDPWYPATTREVNAELSRLLSYLEAPNVVAKTLALLAKAPSQEEQIDYALSLRIVTKGWNIQQRAEFLNWFHKGMTYRGGNSFHGFIRNIRSEAVKSLADEERVALKDVLASVPEPKSPKFETKPRPFVKQWTIDELAPAIEKGLAARNYDKGRNLFGETKCFVCHRFNNEGGGTGPDLTGVIGRFNPRDLLESLIEPSKTISDQYGAVVVLTGDGRNITGRIVNLSGDNVMINVDMLDNNKIVGVNRNTIESIGPSKVSMMPTGLLDTLTQDEILDLVAYLYSRGDRGHAMFKKE